MRRLAEHREQRAELLREDGSLGAIRALATEDDGLNLRLEQLALRLAGVEQELELNGARNGNVRGRRTGLGLAAVEVGT